MTGSNSPTGSTPTNNPKPTSQGADKDAVLRTTERWIKTGAIAAVVIGVAIMALSFSLWAFADGWKLADSGLLGDSFAPLTSLLTVAALLFTVLSVQIQRHELQLQRDEMRKQQKALTEQAKAQTQQVLAQQRMERAYLLMASTMQMSEFTEFIRFIFKMGWDSEDAKLGLDLLKQANQMVQAGSERLKKIFDSTESALNDAEKAIIMAAFEEFARTVEPEK